MNRTEIGIETKKGAQSTWRWAWLGVWLLLLLAACELPATPFDEPTATLPPPTATPLPTLTPTPQPYSLAGWQLFRAELAAAREPDRPPLVNRYLAQLPAAPLTEGNTAVFVYQGAADSVAVIGDMNNWNPAEAWPLARFEGTELWFLEATFEPAARLDYKFLVNGDDFRLDPRNERTMLGGFGPNSELAMPAYREPSEVASNPAVPAGTLTTHVLVSRAMSQTRTVFVYQPAGQLVGAQFPSVYINDGSDFLTLIDAPRLLDRLIAAGTIPPTVAVFIPPIQREFEYHHNDAYVAFLADELAPFVRATYGTDADPARTAVAGASSGGLAAVVTAVTRPEVFGLVLGQSGAYSIDNDAVVAQATLAGRLPVQFYLVVGTYETAIGGDGRVGDLLGAQRRLVGALQGGGNEVTAVELPQGHSWGLWRDTLGAGLAALLR